MPKHRPESCTTHVPGYMQTSELPVTRFHMITFTFVVVFLHTLRATIAAAIYRCPAFKCANYCVNVSLSSQTDKKKIVLFQLFLYNSSLNSGHLIG